MPRHPPGFPAGLTPPKGTVKSARDKGRGTGKKQKTILPLIPFFDRLRMNGLISGQDKSVCEQRARCKIFKDFQHLFATIYQLHFVSGFDRL
jgi:hypothetical protein